jgi:hypothetical protein
MAVLHRPWPQSNSYSMLEQVYIMLEQEKVARIRERAYELFLARENEGDALADWLAAEREIEAQDVQSHHQGPARTHARHLHNTVTDHRGCDIENPT